MCCSGFPGDVTVVAADAATVAGEGETSGAVAAVSAGVPAGGTIATAPGATAAAVATGAVPACMPAPDMYVSASCTAPSACTCATLSKANTAPTHTISCTHTHTH